MYSASLGLIKLTVSPSYINFFRSLDTKLTKVEVEKQNRNVVSYGREQVQSHSSLKVIFCCLVNP